MASNVTIDPPHRLDPFQNPINGSFGTIIPGTVGVAGSSSGTGSLLTTTDGVNWTTTYQGIGNLQGIWGVAYDPIYKKFVAGGVVNEPSAFDIGHPIVAQSNNGFNWSLSSPFGSPPHPSDSYPYAVTRISYYRSLRDKTGLFYARLGIPHPGGSTDTANPGGKYYSSPDGAAWTPTSTVLHPPNKTFDYGTKILPASAVSALLLNPEIDPAYQASKWLVRSYIVPTNVIGPVTLCNSSGKILATPDISGIYQMTGLAYGTIGDDNHGVLVGSYILGLAATLDGVNWKPVLTLQTLLGGLVFISGVGYIKPKNTPPVFFAVGHGFGAPYDSNIVYSYDGFSWVNSPSFGLFMTSVATDGNNSGPSGILFNTQVNIVE